MIIDKKNIFRIEAFVAIGLAVFKFIFGVLRPPKAAPTLVLSAFVIFGIYIIVATKGWSERLLAIVLVVDMALEMFALQSFGTEAGRYANMLFAGIYLAVALLYWSKASNMRRRGRDTG